jgi:hypothetical protein
MHEHNEFNDRVFNTTCRISKLNRPYMWPRSVSEMGGYTQYNTYLNDHNDVGHCDYMLSKPFNSNWSYSPSRTSWEWRY